MKAMLVDITTCIGCRACQAACKEWNELPSEDTSVTTYQNPGSLSGDTWKLVKFIDRAHEPDAWPAWQFYSDSCKHCTDAPCLDACPTAAIAKDENGFVIIDADVCNGNAHCVPACPFHVIEVSPTAGVAQKCTFCHTRVADGLAPACAKVCPTDAIRYDTRETLVEVGRARVERLKGEGHDGVSLYGEDVLGGLKVLYVLPDEASVYDLPDPRTVRRPRSRLLPAWGGVLATAALWLFLLAQLFGQSHVTP